MNTYKAFYKGKTMQVLADTSYEAQKKAASSFKAKKSYDVSVMLLVLNNGVGVVHSFVD